jgi:hypothetical protein
MIESFEEAIMNPLTRNIYIAVGLIGLFLTGCAPSDRDIQTAAANAIAATQKLESSINTAIAQTQASSPNALSTSTPKSAETSTPIPSPTLAFPEIVFSLDSLGVFVNDTDIYTRSAVDIFAPGGEVFINLQIRNLEFPSEDASNGFVIDNNETGNSLRSIDFVYQGNEWLIFEHNHLTGALDLIWTNRSLPLDLECTLHFSADGQSLELILPSGKRNLALGSSLWQVGDRLVIRVQVAPESRFEIAKLVRLVAPGSSPIIGTLVPDL